MNDILKIPTGSRVFLGAPAKAMSQEAVELLRNFISEELGIIEAHIPQCYIPTLMSEPRQVLFIICSTHNSAEQSASLLIKYISEKTLLNGIVDIFPLTVSHELVDTVKGAGCQIYSRKMTGVRSKKTHFSHNK